MYSKIAFATFLIRAARAQQIGTLTAEVHPSLTWQTCTAPGACTTTTGSITLDSNWRWTHSTSSSTNCYTGNTWDATLCPDDVTCAENCALDGADYSGTYGVTTTGDSLKIDFVTTSSQTNVGARLYLMASDTTYEKFNLLNKEFTFDVDVSHLPCGLNGALYMSDMPADGGVSTEPNNKAGAQYGTGYCDSQCPRDLKFIGGEVSYARLLAGIFLIVYSRPTLRDGYPPQIMRILVLVATALAVLRWIFGRPTRFRRRTLHIRVARIR